MKTTIKPLLIIALVLLIGSKSNIAQNVGISETFISPHPSAIVEIRSTERGLLLPRLTTIQRDSIANPAISLIIYNLTTDCFEFYAYGEWHKISCATTCVIPDAPSAGTHVPSETQIVWNWNSVAGATGYKWHTTNNYNAATDLGNTTTVTQTGLICNTSNTIYVWAYNACGNSLSMQYTQETLPCPCSEFIDTRDQIIYQTVEIGNQCWMAENLKYLPSVVGPSVGSITTAYYYVYGYNGTDVASAKQTSNYQTYGVLYNWTAAMAGAVSSNLNPSGVKGACPEGWHLPSDNEWKQMEIYLGMTQEQADLYGFRGTDQGSRMKTTSGWNNNGNGTNSTGFSGLPGGYRFDMGYYYDVGNWGIWRTSTESSSIYAWYRDIHYSSGQIQRSTSGKDLGWSVRCIRN